MSYAGRSTVIRRTQAAVTLRKMILGKRTVLNKEGQPEEKAWPVGQELRRWWARIPEYFCGQGWMRYSTLFENARIFGQRWHEDRRPTREEEVAIGVEFIKYLNHQIRTDPSYLENKNQGRETLGEGRRRMLGRDALAVGLCPYCSRPLPCEAHDVPQVELDKRGGFREIDPGPE